MQLRSLTRRRFVGLLGSLPLSALALLAAYRRPDSAAAPGALRAAGLDGAWPRKPGRPPAGAPLRVGAPDEEPAATAVARELHDFLAQHLPDRTIAYGALDGEVPQVVIAAADLGIDYERQRLTCLFAPVTNWRLPLQSIGPAELAGISGGQLTDWSQLGSPVAGAIEWLDFTPVGALPLPGLPQPIAPVAGYRDFEALVAGLDEHPNGIAIVPIDAIDHRVQTLAIDGLDPLAGRGDLASYPLKHELWLNWDATLGGGLRNALNAFATRYGSPADASSPPGNPVNLTVAGDIILGRTVHARMKQYGDWAHPLRGVAPRLKAADLTIADLECSLSDNTEKPADPFTYLFTTNTAAVAGLTLAGIDGVSLANNHSMNFGKLGLTDTIAVLAAHGIQHFGGGLNLAEARKPAIFEVKGLKIALLGYDGISADEYGAGPDWAGTCPLDRQLVVEDIAAAKAAGAGVVIPFFHWSEEYVAVPSPSMRRLAHLAIDSGAALVLGSHPHWVQGTEWYKGAPILYSLGNFVFDQEWSIETKQGILAEIVLRRGRPVRVRLVPVLIEDYNRPRILGAVEGLPVLRQIYEATDIIKSRSVGGGA